MSFSPRKYIFQVILLHARSDSEQEVEDKQFLIDVDNTLEDILIVLSAEGDPGITLINPTGKHCSCIYRHYKN